MAYGCGINARSKNCAAIASTEASSLQQNGFNERRPNSYTTWDENMTQNLMYFNMFRVIKERNNF